MQHLTADRLIDGCRDDSFDAGLTITTALRPIAGDGSPVKPPIYAPGGGERGAQYQFVRQWLDLDDDAPTLGIVIDNVPSQANRIEAQLERLAPDLGLPEIVLDLSVLEPLPAHAPRRISSYRFPHRVADGYLRDALLDGTPLPRTEVGQELFNATALAPLPLLAWFPQAVALGWWQSHLGKGRSQAKLARSFTSWIVGYDPALALDGTTPTIPRVRGLKGDPLNLSVSEDVVVDEADESAWELGTSKSGRATKRTKLSELGHGQVPFSGDEAAPAPVSFRMITQQTTLSTAGLRRVWVDEPDRNALARAVAAAVVLVGHVAAHGRAFSLRSGADLRPVGTSWTWLGADEDVEIEPLDLEGATSLLEEVVSRAAEAGLPVGPGTWQRLVTEPSPSLAAAIRSTYPEVE